MGLFFTDDRYGTLHNEPKHMNIPSIRSLPLNEKLVLLRADFNVPLGQDGNILDDSRIVETLPTIQHALEQGAKLVITSHLGRPKGTAVPSLSLEPVGARLAKLLNSDVLFAHSCLGDGPKKLIGDLRPGQVILLENTRFHPEEEANDPRFSEALSKNIDVYINDAFGTLHRAHASTAGVAQYVTEKAMGLLVEKELSVLTKLRENPDPPFIVCLGGCQGFGQNWRHQRPSSTGRWLFNWWSHGLHLFKSQGPRDWRKFL